MAVAPADLVQLVVSIRPLAADLTPLSEAVVVVDAVLLEKYANSAVTKALDQIRDDRMADFLLQLEYEHAAEITAAAAPIEAAQSQALAAFTALESD